MQAHSAVGILGLGLMLHSGIVPSLCLLASFPGSTSQLFSHVVKQAVRGPGTFHQVNCVGCVT